MTSSFFQWACCLENLGSGMHLLQYTTECHEDACAVVRIVHSVMTYEVGRRSRRGASVYGRDAIAAHRRALEGNQASNLRLSTAI